MPPTTLDDHSGTASARAISRQPTLSIQPDESTLAIRLGMKQPEFKAGSASNKSLSRGIGDAIAVVAAHHNEETHKQYRPYTPFAGELFDEMERLRCESVGTANRSGIATNLKSLWKNSFQSHYQEESEQLKLVFAYLTKHALKQPVTYTDSTQKILNKWQDTVTNSTSELWPQLFNSQRDQAAFAQTSLQIIATINMDTSNSSCVDMNAGTPQSPDKDQETTTLDLEESTEEDNEDNLSSLNTRDEERDEQEALLTENNETEYDEDQTKNRDAPVDTESDDTESEHSGETLEQSITPYQSYSNSFDEIVHASELADTTELQTLRHSLDQHIEQHKKVVGRLSGQLQRVLMAQQNRHWKFDLEEGLLDTSRLTRIVTQPYTGLSFKEESDIEFRNTVVTLLVDNSKSMLGKPIAIAAACADILAQTLERCGVSVEILGFTTTELHGGELFNLWKQQGKSQNPGRLNGLRHVIYKSADVPYRRAKTGFGLMLQGELLKQNIDGEALLWAEGRLP